MPQKLTNDAIEVLQNLNYDGLAIRFPQVAPTLYSETMKCSPGLAANVF
jgi:hypothetical protein